MSDTHRFRELLDEPAPEPEPEAAAPARRELTEREQKLVEDVKRDVAERVTEALVDMFAKLYKWTPAETAAVRQRVRVKE